MLSSALTHIGISDPYRRDKQRNAKPDERSARRHGKAKVDCADKRLTRRFQDRAPCMTRKNKLVDQGGLIGTAH
jgi:hypothetical protein